MAKGKASDPPEDYVIRSGVRSGLKREFAFALKSQAQLSLSLGRTRSSRKTQSLSPSSTPIPIFSPSISPPSPDPKRFKKSNAPPASLSITPDIHVVADDKIEPVPPKVVEVEDSMPMEEGSIVEYPVVIDIDVHEEESQVDIGSSSLKHTPQVQAPAEPAIESAGPDAGNDGSEGDSQPPESRETAIEMVIDVPRVESGTLAIHPVADKPALEDPKASTPSAESAVGNSVEIPVVINDHEGHKVGNVELGKPSKRFTRSSLKLQNEQDESGVENPVVVDHGCGTKEDASYSLEKPSRRFTRSLLKPTTDDESAVEVCAVAASSCSVGNIDETNSGANLVDDASLSITPSKKMELKMSKKIALNKLPANVRELLGTGLLEGLPVKYVIYAGKNYGLEGVIKGNGILCSCSSCKGTRVVSAYNFEVHSGSTKKHPSDYTFLENGKSLRDVMRECTSAPLDMLESAIQNAIGVPPPIKPYICHKCKELFHTPRIGKFALLCDSCLQPTQHQMTPRPFQGTPKNAKLPRKVLPGDASDGPLKKTSSQKKSIISPKVLAVDTPHSSSKNTFHKKTIGRLTRKDVGLHKLVFMDDILPEGTEVGYYVRGMRLLDGYIKDGGIYCHCCNTVVSPSQFEAHAGRAARRKPYNNIYTSNGVSLHELSVSLSKGRKLSASENDDLCSICADGGDLLLCDLCPRAFHKECVGLSIIPKGDWYCRYCQNMHQREKCLSTNDNAIAAGRVAGVDPIEQIIKRCIRIVTTSTDIGGCALCRSHDFSRSGFDNRTVIICDQCEKEYHVGCLKEHNMCDLKELPEGEWFCSNDCSRIRAALQELIHESQPLQDAHADIIKKKCEEKGTNKVNNDDVRWRLLSGKTLPADSKLLLSEAVTIFHESFDPIVDAVTGRDLIPSMVYGREVRDQDFGGMYCAVLTVNSSVVSAGILRVLGEVAELPLVATSMESQGLGYFQSLFSCIEKLLESLKVKHFVLPSADEAKSIWTKKFGFSEINPDQLREYSKGAHPMIFQGTSMLYKPVRLAEATSRDSHPS